MRLVKENLFKLTTGLRPDHRSGHQSRKTGLTPLSAFTLLEVLTVSGRREREVKLPAFTLLEVLIAVGVLFIVGTAIVSLTNTLIQGTISTADATVTDLWAAEGLELVTKHRDDRTKADQTPVWLDQAQIFNNYGWYYAELKPDHKVELTRATFNGGHILKSEAFDDTDSRSQLQSEGLNARRLICVEAIGALSVNAVNDRDRLRCNLDQHDRPLNDGSRTVIGSDCQTNGQINDLYCQMTKASLNKNNVLPTLIPSGNAVKVRSVIVWQNQQGYQTTEMSTFLTNWRRIDQ